MAILSASFIILSAFINQTVFVNRPPGVTQAYIYLFRDATNNSPSSDENINKNYGYWIELQKNIVYGVPVFQANITNFINDHSNSIENEKLCETADVISYRLRLVYFNDRQNYGDTAETNKILITKLTSCHDNGTTPAADASTTENYNNYNTNDTIAFNKTEIVANNSCNSNNVYNCTLKNVLLLCLSVNSFILGVVYIAVKVICRFYINRK